LFGRKESANTKYTMFAGRNIYSHKPVVKVTLDIGELYKLPTKDLGDFNERLLALFPGLKKTLLFFGI